MNLGQIPGYYYDAEKKKYFKIQANHVAPTDAKHAASNVNREQRQTKKRKIEDRRREKQLQQTVHRSRIVQHPLLAGTSLTREVGYHRSSAVGFDQRDAAFVDQLRPDRINLTRGTGGSTTSVWDVQPLSDGKAGIAVSSDLVSLHMVSEDSDTLPALVAVTQESKSPGNLFIGDRPSAHREFSRSNLFTLGQADTALWSSSLNLSKEMLAISGTENIFIANLAVGDVVHRLHLNDESRDVTWLNENTVAYGHHDVELWDVRSSGNATRFPRRHQPITGIQSPNKHGIQLLVSDNKHLELYDTRMGKSPLRSFTHKHQGPQLQFTVHEGLQIVTAVDIDNDVQTFSLRSGRPLGALRQPGDGQKALYSKLRWLDAEGGLGERETVLQACQGDSVPPFLWKLSYIEPEGYKLDSANDVKIEDRAFDDLCPRDGKA
ncbi:hypothetical protein B0A55_01144 [Friedmanniomyces simplex]|uniref:Uncharacterized protein n=1 Tax=Friedmanniomyces simplex TaxID=329884 RepID=A0A4U0XVE8_9PEZI|nr:hypothetical protein B0A55_01144 [Friedmanniomyces simplex]